MPPSAIRFESRGSTLLAVPSVHYRAPFALAVHGLFYSSQEAPEAVAVELGNRLAQAALEWVSELSGSRGRPEAFPIMLGLARRNLLIRASLKEEALALQRETGRDLSELPPEMLREKLGFCGQRVMHLSPTDSIVEAVRSSFELGLPLYGVDLDDVADDVRGRSLVPDPWLAAEDVAGYVCQNQAMAAEGYDPETDSRRELAMAARLKTLMSRHRRVLFVCGLGHWKRIHALLEDPSVRPASVPEPDAPRTCPTIRRVIVDPALALLAIDLWPAMVQLYEARRAEGRLSGSPPAIAIPEVRNLLVRQLQTVYTAYWCPDGPGPRKPRPEEEPAACRSFESFLDNLCLLHGRALPDLSLLLQGARALFSPAFTAALGKTFMDYPWASPDQYPYPVLTPRGGSGSVPLCSLDETPEGPGGRRCFVRPQLAPQQTSPGGPEPWRDRAIRQVRSVLSYFYSRHTWGPWDYLVSALSLQALRTTRRGGRVPVSELFAGGPAARIDVRATLRSFIRSEEDLYVINPAPSPQSGPLELCDADPVVWFLADQPDPRARWNDFSVSLAALEKHARDRAAFAAARSRLHDSLVCLVTYGVQLGAREAPVNHPGVAVQRLDGFVLYHPICWKYSQFARWAEVTGFRKNPFCGATDALFRGLPAPLRELCSLKRREDWRIALLLMALPYARRRVVFVANDGFAPPAEVAAAARARGIQFCRAPASDFSPDHLERLRWNYLTPLEQLEPDFIYPAWVEEAIGESQYLYRDLVPEEWLHFGEEAPGCREWRN